MEKIFETAIRNKFRFAFKGMISVEDLWDLRLESLDDIYKNLVFEKKKVSEESLLQTKTKTQEYLECKINIVRYIAEVKVSEMENRARVKEKKEQKQRILEILNEKENQDLKNKSTEELRLMLDNM
ncbi:MAG: hypothetical protein ACRCX2_02240 [Paraclostridium sp.]